MADSAISDVIIDAIVSGLTSRLSTEIPEADVTRANKVQGGKLQENPVGYTISVTAHIGDPDELGDDWADEVALPDDPHIPHLAFMEVGGDYSGIHWWRKGVVKIEVFFVRNPELSRDESREKANIVRARAERLLGEGNGAIGVGLVDSFGEQTIVFYPTKSHAREAGGPRQFIWHIKIWWKALTAKDGA